MKLDYWLWILVMGSIFWGFDFKTWSDFGDRRCICDTVCSSLMLWNWGHTYEKSKPMNSNELEIQHALSLCRLAPRHLSILQTYFFEKKLKLAFSLIFVNTYYFNHFQSRKSFPILIKHSNSPIIYSKDFIFFIFFNRDKRELEI